MNRICYGVTAGVLLFSAMTMHSKEFARNLNYRICIPDQPTKVETAAAKELANYLEKTYTEKIRLNGSDAPILFSVGFAPEALDFTKEKDESFEEIGFYHNTTGEWEASASEELEEVLDKIGAPKTLQEIGVDEAILPLTFEATKDIRDKYVLSRLCWDLGVSI